MNETSGIGRRRAAARDERSATYVQRRKEIIRAAARVFKSKGLQGASLGDIAAEADADRASLYYYVGSKEELFHEVVREAVEANLAIGEEVLAGAGDAQQKLRHLIESLMRSYAEYFPVLYVFIQENLSRVPKSHSGWANDMRRVNHRYERILIEIIQQGIDEGSIRSFAPARELAYGVLGTLGWTHRWFNPSTSTLSAAELGRIYADMILGGLATRGRTRAAASKATAATGSTSRGKASTAPAAKTAAGKAVRPSEKAARTAFRKSTSANGTSTNSKAAGATEAKGTASKRTAKRTAKT